MLAVNNDSLLNFSQFGNFQCLVASFGTIDAGRSQHHDANTIGGMSGGGVFMFDSNCNQFKFVGIHTGWSWVPNGATVEVPCGKRICDGTNNNDHDSVVFITGDDDLESFGVDASIVRSVPRKTIIWCIYQMDTGRSIISCPPILTSSLQQ